MKALLYTLFFACISIVHAQNNDTTTQTKPAWVDKIPERKDAPDIDVQYQPDTEFDVNDLARDRDALFGDDDEDEEEPLNVVDKVIVPDIEKVDQEAEQAARLAEQESLAQEQKLAEQKAEQDKLLEKERQDELNRIAEQQRIDDAATQKLADEEAAKKIAEQQAQQSTENTTSTGDTYTWKRIKNVAPEYPAKAARNGDEGWVSVRIEIDIYGDVVNAKVVDTYRKVNMFNKAALKAVRQWKFDPPVNYGIETNQTKDIKINFKL